jgi:hypothetical protein
VISVRESTLGEFEVYRHIKGVRSKLYVSKSLKEAVASAESEIPGRDRQVMMDSASWRREPPTDKQIARLFYLDKTLRSQHREASSLLQMALSKYHSGDLRFSRGNVSDYIDRKERGRETDELLHASIRFGEAVVPAEDKAKKSVNVSSFETASSQALTLQVGPCPNCRQRIPYSVEFRCPLCDNQCSALDWSGHCPNCDACFYNLLLRPFGNWPERANQCLDARKLGTQEAVEEELVKMMGSVGSALYPALTKAYVTYCDWLISWCEAVIKNNPESRAILLDRQRLQFERSLSKAAGGGPPGSAKSPLLSHRWDIEMLQNLSGYDFEVVVAVLFLKMGYTVQLTPRSRDQGADLILTDRNSTRIAVQAKNYRYPVSNGAVQEVLGGMSFHDCKEGIVVTTSEFTTSANQLATTHFGISLWDAKKLERVWAECFPADQ